MKNRIFLAMMTTIFSASVAAQTSSADSTTRYFEKIKQDPQQLLVFLQSMPKGGDLHNHHGGAAMAENMIRYATGDQLCVDRQDYRVGANIHCAAADTLDQSIQDSTLYNALINAWSMRNFHPGQESGHDHFFATFGKYGPIVDAHTGEVLTEIVERAGEQNELYIELMVTPDKNASGLLGKQLSWDSDLAVMRQKLFAAGLDRVVKDISKKLKADEDKLNQSLFCGTPQAKSGCLVKVRYLYQILREQPPVQVFAQLLAGFEAAKQDTRIVGINMVQPEDGVISMRDYRLHMRMVGFLHQIYPDVHISLHAGELTSGLVPPAGLRFHIRDAVEVAHAERVGHGVDIAYEDNAEELLQKMAKQKVMVEINLSSNDQILGVKGEDHPLPLYLHYGVPVALSTDDEGVLRTNLTEQYQKAILTYHFTYPVLKNLVRNSISYSFLPGANLWLDKDYQRVIGACAKDKLGAQLPTRACGDLLKASEKARMQWDLEKRFGIFEEKWQRDI